MDLFSVNIGFCPSKRVEVVFIYQNRYPQNVYSPLEIGNMAYTLRESNKIIVVTPDNADTHDFVEWWCDNNPGFPASDLWPEKMPELLFMNVPNLCQYIRFMKDDEEVEDYLATPDIGYNPSIPDIYVSINFDSYPFIFEFLAFFTWTISEDRKNWTYTIRPNQVDVPTMYSEELYG